MVRGPNEGSKLVRLKHVNVLAIFCNDVVGPQLVLVSDASWVRQRNFRLQGDVLSLVVGDAFLQDKESLCSHPFGASFNCNR